MKDEPVALMTEYGIKPLYEDALQEGMFLYTHPAKTLTLTKAEIESGLSRVKWAELLIKQLPEEHEGRNSWLLNYGEGK